MYDSTIRLISTNALNKVEIPNFDIVESKDFHTLYKNNISFYHVTATYKDARFNLKEYKFCVTSQEVADDIVAKMKAYNKELERAKEIALEEYATEYKQKVDSGEWDWQEHDYDKSTYRSFSSVGWEIGFCCVYNHYRNKLEEERKEREEWERLTPKEKREYEESANQPYGGAFSSWDDYWRYREG